MFGACQFSRWEWPRVIAVSSSEQVTAGRQAGPVHVCEPDH